VVQDSGGDSTGCSNIIASGESIPALRLGLMGEAVVRYSDDFVMGFQYRSDAEQFQTELKERLSKFSLEMHEGKTKLIEFGRFVVGNRKKYVTVNQSPSCRPLKLSLNWPPLLVSVMRMLHAGNIHSTMVG